MIYKYTNELEIREVYEVIVFGGGTAAALCAKKDGTTHSVNFDDIRNKSIDNGVIL